jgi:hypothetical protein
MDTLDKQVHDLRNRITALKLALDAVHQSVVDNRDPGTATEEIADTLRAVGYAIPCLTCEGVGRLEECGRCGGCCTPGESARFGGRAPGCGGPCPKCVTPTFEPDDDDRNPF